MVGARQIVHAKRNAMVIPKVKLRKISVQMLLFAMLVNAARK
jgi:hypothetical protein